MKRFTFLLTMLILVFIACSKDFDGNSDVNSGSGNTTDTQFIVSSYVRGDFYNMGRISTESLNACTDLICIGATPNQDGTLSFDTFNLHNGEGVTTIESLIALVREQLTGSTKIRLGISGGDYWKTMVADETARTYFAQNVKTAIQDLAVDGVDLDFEWAETTEEYDNYSQAIIAINTSLGSNYTFSVSLDPYSYKLSTAAIDAVSYVSLQCYGSLPTFFSYENYVTAIIQLIDYGIPADKLVPGVPFYGVAANGSKETIAYYNLVNDVLISSASINQADYQGISYVFNGQDLIHEKTQYALQENYLGMMSWDLATDVAYDNQWSLLKAMKTVIANYR